MSLYDAQIAYARKNNAFFGYESLLDAEPTWELQSTDSDGRTIRVQRSDGSIASYPAVATSFEKAPGEFVIIQGFGSANALQAAMACAHVRDILVYEPDAAYLKTALSRFNLSAHLSDPRIRFVFGRNRDVLEILCTAFVTEDLARLARLASATIIVSPGAATDSADYRLFQDVLRETVEQQIQTFKDTPIEDNFRGFMNSARNFPEYFLNPHIDELAGIYAGKTAVVVGTAPSLTHTLPFLKAHQDRLLICAVDSVLALLLQEGIVPDYVVTLERIRTERHFANLPEMPQTYLVAPAVVPPATLAAFKGPKLVIERDVGFENWFSEPRNREFLGSTVSHLGYVVMRRLGCETILLAGQDFAYDPVTSSSYSGFAPEHIRNMGNEVAENLKHRELTVRGASGNAIRTTAIWTEWVRVMSELIVRHGGNVVQMLPPDYGIAIPHASVMTPQAALQQFAATLPGKNRLESERLSGRPLVAGWEERAAKRLQRCAATLRHYADTSLAALRELGTFWMDHNTVEGVVDADLQRAYESLFARMEANHENVLAYDDGFFDSHFLAVLTTSHALVGIRIANVLATEKHFARRVHALMLLLHEWYGMIHHWSSRVLETIEHLNSARWRLW